LPYNNDNFHTDDSIHLVDPSLETIIPEAAHIDSPGIKMVDTPEGTLVTIDAAALAQQNVDAGAAAVPSGPAIDSVRLARAGPGNGNSAAAAGSSGSVALLMTAAVALLVLLGL
jgi:hypothetical protein